MAKKRGEKGSCRCREGANAWRRNEARRELSLRRGRQRGADKRGKQEAKKTGSRQEKAQRRSRGEIDGIARTWRRPGLPAGARTKGQPRRSGRSFAARTRHRFLNPEWGSQRAANMQPPGSGARGSCIRGNGERVRALRVSRRGRSHLLQREPAIDFRAQDGGGGCRKAKGLSRLAQQEQSGDRAQVERGLQPLAQGAPHTHLRAKA